ncbi:hypothetical protein K438DRAFT_816058 [Mycena galopus ATCC 62051]|nr:hypothetical protein K438DRAFT_816058 [Mycena galopus ATCC 62051]
MTATLQLIIRSFCVFHASITGVYGHYRNRGGATGVCRARSHTRTPSLPLSLRLQPSVSASHTMVISTGTAAQFNQILWIFVAILVLYILFGVLFLVMSHLQERLQRRPEGQCPMRQYTLNSSRSWDAVSLSCDSANGNKDEGHICTLPINIQLRYENLAQQE